MHFCTLFILLVIGVFGNEEIYEEKQQGKKILDENLVPIFEDIQPEFGLIHDSPASALENNNSKSTLSNVTLEESSSITNNTNSSTKIYNCLRGGNTTTVQLVNDTELIRLLVPDPKVSSEKRSEKNAPALCFAVLFYSKNCPFSSMAAPHFNALARAFPDVKMVAINAMRYHIFNTQHGIVGVPTLLLFHNGNGRSFVKYNRSEYNFDAFVKFISKYTGIEPVENSVVTSQDFAGPVVSSPSKESDMFLVISWLFIIICSCYYFSKSKVWKWVVEAVQRNWRESEQHAQHEHMD